MSSSGLNWSPIIDAWINKRESAVASILKKCVDASFFRVYEWSRQNLFFKMPILECNVVFQVK